MEGEPDSLQGWCVESHQALSIVEMTKALTCLAMAQLSAPGPGIPSACLAPAIALSASPFQG